MANSSSATCSADHDEMTAPGRTSSSSVRDPYWQPFAARFQRERERLGLTFEDASLLTKIHPRFLKAIERGDFKQLPGGILSKNFLRTYAQSVGMDRVTIAHCLEAAGLVRPVPPAEESVAHHAPIAPLAPKTRSGLAVVASGLLLAVMMLVYYQGDFLMGQLARWADKMAKAQGISNYPGLAANDVQPTKTPPGPDAAAPSMPISRLASMHYPAGAFYIEIMARQDAWLSINADGSLIMQNTLTAPAQKMITARRRVVIRAGNVGGLDFVFNGQPLPSQGDYDQARTLVFSTQGLESDFSRKAVVAQIE